MLRRLFTVLPALPLLLCAREGHETDTIHACYTLSAATLGRPRLPSAGPPRRPRAAPGGRRFTVLPALPLLLCAREGHDTDTIRACYTLYAETLGRPRLPAAGLPRRPRAGPGRRRPPRGPVPRRAAARTVHPRRPQVSRG